MLRHVRSVLVRAPHVNLRQLRRLDDRIAAHLDGLAVAGRCGTSLCTAALERPGAGEVFALAVRLIDERDEGELERLVALAGASSDARRGLLSAFGWVSAPALQGLVRGLLASGDAPRRRLGLAACRLHRADPAAVLPMALRDADADLRAEALRTAGELGRTDLLPQALSALTDDAPVVALRAAVCACLLGHRGDALALLERLALSDGEHRDEAVAWLLPVIDLDRGRELLRRLARAAPPGSSHKRRIVRASGWLGDVQHVPWLIELMADDALARLAGESFSMITGADLAKLQLEREPPENLQGGPSESPEDDDVAMDEDDSLPWPDRDKVQAWWKAHAARMPADARCFMGAVPAVSHAEEVLRSGFQRQRIVAARHRAWLAPGMPLFPVCAPAWRQERTLQVTADSRAAAR